MAEPLALVVADQRGLNVRSLLEALYLHYRTPQGMPVMPRLGQGEYVDGVPTNTIRLTNREPT